MKKVLHLITGLEKGGGAEAMLLKTLPYLEKTENVICVLKGRGEISKQLEQKGIKVYYLDMKNYFDIGVISRYKKVIREYEPDIQVNYLIHADVFGRILAKKFGAGKVVSYIRNRHTNFTFSFLDRITLRKVDYLLTNSQANLGFYREKYDFPKNRSACIPNGIKIDNEIDSEALGKLKQEFDILGDEFIITCVARLHKQKNIDTLVRAVQKLQEKSLNFKVLICGEGKERNKLKELAKKLSLQDNILFLRNRDDALNILNISDVFVLPSAKEGMSNALLEAMSIGLPCIVSNIEENTELVRNGENGLTFKVKKPKDLCAKIEELIGNEVKKSKMGEKSINIIKEKYNINKIIKKLDVFLSNL